MVLGARACKPLKMASGYKNRFTFPSRESDLLQDVGTRTPRKWRPKKGPRFSSVGELSNKKKKSPWAFPVLADFLLLFPELPVPWETIPDFQIDPAVTLFSSLPFAIENSFSVNSANFWLPPSLLHNIYPCGKLQNLTRKFSLESFRALQVSNSPQRLPEIQSGYGSEALCTKPWKPVKDTWAM